MGSALGLGSIFGGTAQAGGLGSALSGLTSGLGSGLGAGQNIGGNAANNAIADALGWTYGYGDQTGSLTAQEALAAGPGGDGTGPTALGTANQYMQGQQQGAPQDQAQADTGQPTPAQQALDRLPAVPLVQAYGAQGPWAPGGSTSPEAAAQGPQGFAQVAGPPTGTQMPPGGYTAPERSAVTSYGSPVTPGATYSAASPEQMQAARGALSQGLQQKFGATTPMDPSAVPLPQPRPAGADATPADVPLPQPRPAVADAAPPRAAAPPAAARLPAPLAATPPAANDPAAGAVPQAAGQGAAQNPIQAIMQALGLQNLPPQMQQAAQQIISQVLGQLMPQLQGMMGGQQGQPFGGGSEIARNPYTGQPILDRQGRPQRWDQIPWSQGWDPAQQKQGAPWRQWEPAPGEQLPARRPAVPANPPPVIKAPRTVAQLQTPPESWERPMTPEERRREEMRGMTPQELKRLRERIKRMHEKRIEMAQA